MKISKTIYTIVFMSIINIGYAQNENKVLKNIKQNGKIYAVVFGDYYYKFSGNSYDYKGKYNNLKKKDNAFSFRRIYLGYKHKISDKFGINIMFESDDSNLLTNQKRAGNIKYAYIKWKNIYPLADLIIGAQSTPTWSRFTEKAWGYRSLEKTIMDFNKVGSSSDFGISINGKFNKTKTFGYSIMIGNGKAQKNENNIYKKIYASLNAKLLNKKLLFEIYGDYEPSGVDTLKYTVKLFAGLNLNKISLGIEPYYQYQKNFEIENHANNRLMGAGFFAKAKFSPKLYLILRYDINDLGYNLKYKTGFSLIALDYQPFEKVHIMPNLWSDSYYSKNTSTPELKTGYVARITFAFKVNK